MYKQQQLVLKPFRGLLIKSPIIFTELYFIPLCFYNGNIYFDTNVDERFCEFRHISCFQGKLSHLIVHFKVDITIKISTIREIWKPHKIMKICIFYCHNILDQLIHFSLVRKQIYCLMARSENDIIMRNIFYQLYINQLPH